MNFMTKASATKAPFYYFKKYLLSEFLHDLKKTIKKIALLYIFNSDIRLRLIFHSCIIQIYYVILCLLGIS